MRFIKKKMYLVVAVHRGITIKGNVSCSCVHIIENCHETSNIKLDAIEWLPGSNKCHVV